MANEKKANLLYSLIVPFVTLILSVGISHIQNEVGLLTILLALVISTLLYFGTLYILSKNVTKNIIENNSEEVESVKRLINEKINDDIGHLMSTDDGVYFEKKRKICSSCRKNSCQGKKNATYKCKEFCDEIWLLTQDLEEDQEGGPYAQVVTDNLKKGIKYVYIVPKDDDSIKAKIDDIKINNNNNPNLKIFFLSKSLFFLSPKLDLSIYNPTKIRGAERRAFMGMPLEGKTERYQVAVSEDLIITIVGMIKSEIEKQN